MKNLYFNFRHLQRAAVLGLGLCFGSTVWAAPSIQSIDVSPNPMVTGHTVTISVTTSPGITRGAALVDFRSPRTAPLQIALTNQGVVWSGSAVVPTDLARQLPSVAGALVRVAFFDAAGRPVVGAIPVGVNVEVITAVFDGGVLTVTG